MQHCSVFPLSYNDGATGNGALNTVTLGTGDQAFFTYDPLNRLTEELVKSPDGTTLFKHAIAYKNRENNQTTNLVQFYNVRRADGSLIAGNRYSYDNMGNITAIKQSTGSYFPLVSYGYDDQGQLISEKFYDGIGNGESHITDSYTYTYDTAGNILSVKKNGVTIKSYTYSTGDWKDLLTAVDGSPIVYEGQTYSGGTVSGTAISGNPIRYTNGTQTYTNLTWQHGRQLTSLTTNGRTYTYDYDVDGIRTEKVGDGVGHDYITQNGKVVREHITSYNGWDWILDFIYDNAGRPFALKYSNDGGENFTTYYYVLNLQGDVVALLNASGTVIARYTYNAWGKLLSVTTDNGTAITNPLDIAHLNPLRYRGYYYDSETGFYYLQSRYYDPVSHRFINADSIASTGQGFIGTNMFAYCLNNPLKYVDVYGTVPLEVAVEFLLKWLWGDGSDVVYGSDTEVSRAFSNSPTTKKYILQAFQKFLNGEKYDSGTINYSSEEPDLWLAARNVDYRITIHQDTSFTFSANGKTTKKTRYTITMVIFDTYNFNKGDEKGDGWGSTLNNMGHFVHKHGLGTDYYWEVQITKEVQYIETGEIFAQIY